MKTLHMITKYNWFASILISCSILISMPCFADDTCVFTSTANDVPPNIVLLLDNGAEMEHAIWHPDYDNSVDCTPATGTEFTDGFFNEYGYTIYEKNANLFYIMPILSTLEPDSNTSNGLVSTSQNTFTVNGRSIALPYQPSAAVDGDGIKDNATRFRYSKNYLNWLFFSTGAGSYVDESDVDDGTDLPTVSRFYYAKQAIMTVAKLTSNKAQFGIYNFTSTTVGASNVQPLGMVVATVEVNPEDNVLESNFVNNVNNMGTVTHSPLAEGLGSIGGYYASPSSGVVGEYCQKSFALVISPGVSSEDQACAAQSSPGSLSDYDEDNVAGGIVEGNIKIDNTKDNIDNDNDGTTDEADEAVTAAIPTNHNGSTYLDDVAHYMYTHDIVDYQAGFQNIWTYTVGFMGDTESNAFLINTSNNGNGYVNLYDTNDPDYGKSHFTAESPDALSEKILDAVNAIVSKTNSFTAPVVPVTRTMSGNRIYLAFFLPNEGNLWAGNITKYGLSEFGKVLDKYGNAATYDNGAMIEGAEPYWATEDWKDIEKVYLTRSIYTYLGASKDLTIASNGFNTDNAALTTDAGAAAVLGNPTHTTTEIINYIRGKDVFDDDGDGVTDENRAIICGDALHSEPLVVRYNDATTMVYFGGNDGMLHAVDNEDGSEAWAFIPPDQLHRLKDIVEGTGHQYFIDSSPKAYIVESDDDDDDIEPGEGDKVYIICGERKGGTSYFALDVTNMNSDAKTYEPKFLWRICQIDDSAAPYNAPVAPDVVIPELGETWSPPVFGRVKYGISDDETDVFFIGGGYKSDNTKGNTVLAIDVLAGALIRQFKVAECPEMTYCFPSPVIVVDRNGNGLVDKVYVGDRGGQLWRFGEFTGYDFPNGDANIDNWSGVVLFQTGCGESDCANVADDNSNTLIDERRPFFYRPSVCLEHEYDLVFAGTGDREYPCNEDTYDGFYCVKDTHATPLSPLTETDLVYVDNSAADPNTPDLSGSDDGWYVNLAQGEKVLADNLVFRKVVYFTTFTPNDDPCTPGGDATLYALDYLTGHTVEEYGVIGGGIPSKPVLIITEKVTKILVSVGSTNAEPGSGGTGSGTTDKLTADDGKNFFYLWWQEVFN